MRLIRTFFFVALIVVSGLIWMLVTKSGQPEQSNFDTSSSQSVSRNAEFPVSKSETLEPKTLDSERPNSKTLTEDTFDVVVNFSGTELGEGLIIAGLFDSAKNFGKRNVPVQRCEVTTISQGNAVCEFSNLPPGHYAISAFQDSNGNSKLDKNGFGKPLSLIHI